MFFFLSILLSGSRTVVAQDFSSLLKKAADVVTAKNPSWKLIRKEAQDKEVTYLWGPATKADVMLSVFYGASEQDAAEKMGRSLKFVAVGPNEKLAGLGDEAYLWRSYGRSVVIIRFRKSNVYIDLTAPSVAMAEDLARSLADLIPGK